MTLKIDPTVWPALSQLLDTALELPVDARASWLDSLDAVHDALKPQLRDLLAQARVETGDFLRTLPRIDERALAPRQSSGSTGEIVGPYRLLRQIGSGGMASVWLAERTDGLMKRPVALKLPHITYDIARRQALAERMAREREILAALNHPQITTLYDAGVTGSGQPYLALEYVSGVAIDQFCTSRKLAIRERLKLFLQVARAVAYAHGMSVVHRDLKPSNILVTPDGQVQLLDFGVAKLLAQDRPDKTRLTELSGRALTPDYASPEQILGVAITTSSDVYSLGVILFELLTDTRPYQLNRESRGALEDAILQADPPRPSTVVSKAQRAVVAGDLDAIVMTALRKLPAARFATVHAFAEDIERYLDNRPVLARPDSRWYRTRKFVRRHRVAVSAAALLGVTLIAGTIGTTTGMMHARSAEAAARSEAATAERYSMFLVDMFEVAAPEQSKGREVSAGEILQQGAVRVRRELANEPLLEARLLATIGWVYTRQGLYTDATPILDEAVALARTVGERGNMDLARALVRRGEAERKLNEPSKAETDDRNALAILERMYGPNDVRVEPATTELGLLLRISDPEKALRLYRRSRDLLVAARGESDGDAAVLLGNMGSIYLRAHRYQEAQDAFERALPWLSQHFGAQDPHVATVLRNLANLYRNTGDYARAVETAQRSVEVFKSVSGPEHPDLGIAWQSLALSSDKLGDTRLALEQIDRAIDIFRLRLPVAHPFRIQAANVRAGLLIELGQFGGARKSVEDVAVTGTASLETRRSVLNGMVVLAEIERLERQWLKSQAVAERVLADPAVRGDRFLEADARWARAYALAMQAKTEEAEAEFARVLQLDPAVVQGPAFSGVFARAKYYVCAGDEARALAILREAVAKGFHDPIILRDPALASLRDRADFAPLAAAFPPRRPPDSAAAP